MASVEAGNLATGPKRNLLQRFVPITVWAPAYQRGWLGTDLIAGLAVWAMTVPQVLAYAGVAGVPAVYALRTVPLAMIAYAVFGTSRTLSVGPDSALAMLSAATVGGLAAQGTEEYLALTAVLALMAGVLFLDTTGTDQLIKLHGDLQRDGIELTFAEVRDPVRDMMRRAGADGVIGEENFHGSVDEGVLAFLKREKDGPYNLRSQGTDHNEE